MDQHSARRKINTRVGSVMPRPTPVPDERSVDPLYYLSLASTVCGLAAVALLIVAAIRRRDRLLWAGVGAAVATSVTAAVAVWPPDRWTDATTVFGIVAGPPLLGACLCLLGHDRHPALSAVGIAVLLVGIALSIPAFGERFVAP
jgi:MFS family permease